MFEWELQTPQNKKTRGRESIHGFSVFGAPIKTLVLDLEIILKSLPVKNPNGGSIIDSRLNPLTFKIEKRRVVAILHSRNTKYKAGLYMHKLILIKILYKKFRYKAPSSSSFHASKLQI